MSFTMSSANFSILLNTTFAKKTEREKDFVDDNFTIKEWLNYIT